MPKTSIPLVDELIRSKRKTISIIIQRDGKVVVRAPLRAAEVLIRQFVESKRGWIEEKKAWMAQQAPKTAWPFSAGEKFLLLGQAYPLEVSKSQRAALTFNEAFILHEKALPQARQLFEKWYRARALTTLTERVKLYAAKFGLRYSKIRISSARTRWGSCSSLGTLSFSWRLVMAPLDVIDYVVIHELAHLKEQNHSARFWAEVEAMMPGYKRQLAWLKTNGERLTLD